MLCWSISLDFFYLTFFFCFVKFWTLGYLYKTTSSFGGMCYLIQNRLLYLPAKYQGQATAWTWVISKYQNGKPFCYTRCMWRFCVLTVFWKGFLSGWWSWYTRLCTCAERLHWDFSARNLLLRWGRHLYRQASFSSLCRFRAICCEFKMC